jgi:N-carbamoylputrescine amidase
MATSKTKVALIQMACSGDKHDNVDRAVARIQAAAALGADVVCLQELFAGTYPCQEEDHRKFDEAESIPGPTSQRIAAAARDNGVVVVGSFFERRAKGLFHNTAVVFERDGSPVGMYRKMHIPDDPHYYEKFYFTPGDLGFQSFDTSAGCIGVCICWDQWFPEAARLTALAGADIIFYPTAIGWLRDEKDEFGAAQRDSWETVMRGHAIANGVYIAAANRRGIEDHIEFWGSSFVANPHGQVLARAAADADETLCASCDFVSIDTVRTHWPFLRDRRIDAYGGLLDRFGDGQLGDGQLGDGQLGDGQPRESEIE